MRHSMKASVIRALFQGVPPLVYVCIALLQASSQGFPPASGNTPTAPRPGEQTAGNVPPAGAANLNADGRAEVYYDVTMAHLYEVQYESSNQSDDANKAIDFYKKAYLLDPTSPVIGEQLAEMYFVAQRVRDAVNEAQEILRREPGNLPARRLLARIYLLALLAI